MYKCPECANVLEEQSLKDEDRGGNMFEDRFFYCPYCDKMFEIDEVEED